MARRNRRLGTLAAPLLLIGLVGGSVSAAAPDVVGIAAAIVKDVRIKSAAARQFAKAALRQRVAIADQVETGSASRLQMILLDQSKFTVGPSARLTIDRFVYDPRGGSMSASVAKGAFRFMSGRSGGRKDSSIKSPAASIGIRGTLLDGVVGEQAVAIARGEREIRGNIRHDPATATLVVLRGPGPGRQGSDAVGAIDVTAGGTTVTLDRPLEAAYVPFAGAQPITFTISSPGIAELNDLLLEPREVLSNPDAESLLLPQPERERPYYDGDRRGSPGGFGDDGPSRPSGGFGPVIPGIDNLPQRPQGNPQRPQNPRPSDRNPSSDRPPSQPQGTGTTTTPSTQPSPATGAAGPNSTPSSYPSGNP